MKSIRLINASRTLAADQDAYNELDIMDVPVGGVHGEGVANCMFSVWEPSPEELEALNNGGRIQLGIMGMTHPPVIMLVQDGNAGIVGDENPEGEDTEPEESNIIDISKGNRPPNRPEVPGPRRG